MKYGLFVINLLLIGCGERKESCADVLMSIKLIEENTDIQQNKLTDLKIKLANEQNESWQRTIQKTVDFTNQKIIKNNEMIQEINRKNQRCFSS